MTKESNIRRAALFGIMILLPAAVLTTMSVRTLVSEDRNALADLQLRLPWVQSQFDEIIDGVILGRWKTAPPKARRFTFFLDMGRRIVSPRFVRVAIAQRRPELTESIKTGYQLEFVKRHRIRLSRGMRVF